MSEDIEKYSDKDAFLSEIEALRPDLYYSNIWTKAEKDTALEELRPSKMKASMLTAIPMMCKGRACVVAEVCPLIANGTAPVSMPCPIEMALVQQLFQAYIEELGVDTSRMVEVSMIRSLVDQEIQYFRKSKILSLEHFIQENVAGVDGEGQPILRKELHFAVELEDKIHKRMEKLRTQLLATRESRAKVGQNQLDAAQAVANLLDERREMQKHKEQILREKLGLTKRDDYIAAHQEIIEAEVVSTEE